VWTKLNIKTSGKRQPNESELTENENFDGKESEEGYFKRNELLEAHHKDVLYFQEKSEPQLKVKDEAQTLRDVEAKMKLNEILDFLAAIKKRDRETKEEMHDLSKVETSTKIINTLPNGTINFYADEITGIEKKPGKSFMNLATVACFKALLAIDN